MSEKPDMLLILVDQWNPRMLGCAGHPQVQTPNVDRLASEGVRFDCAYTQSPVCMPARVSLASAQYPHNHGLWSNMTEYRFPASRLVLFRDLRNAGYETAKIGKFHYEEPGMPHDDISAWYDSLGIDHPCELPEPYGAPWYRNEYSEFLKGKGLLETYLDDLCDRFDAGDATVVRPAPLPPNDHPDSYVARRVIEIIDRCHADRPLFLCVSFPGPHSPFDAPGEYARLFDPEEMELPPNVPEIVTQGKHRYDRAHIRRAQASYFGRIRMIDDRIGDIISRLKLRGKWDDTLVIFAADHGENLGAHGRFFKGTFNYESAGIPLILRWPLLARPGTASQAPVQLIDIYRTLLDAAGLEPTPTTFGASLLPIASGRAETTHEAVFSEIAPSRSGHFNYMVRTQRYLWYRNHRAESLFDMQEDPYEMTDLAGDRSHRQTVCEMRERLHAFLEETQVNDAATYVSLFGRIERDLPSGESIGNYLRSKFQEIHFG